MRRRDFMAGTLVGAVLVGGVAGPPGAHGQVRRFRLGHNNTTTSITHFCATAFAEAVAERSAGRFSVEVFPNAGLGSEAQMLKAVAGGALDMSVPPSGVFKGYSQDTALIELPYLFRGADHARQALDGRLGRHCAGQLRERGMIVLGWGEIGVRQMTANRPIRSPADLQGLKVRMPLSEPILETFNALGARAGMLSFSQMHDALRTGTFEAQENPINVIVDHQFYTVQSHLSLTSHVYTPMLIIVSRDVFEELAPMDRELLSRCGLIAAEASRRRADEMDAEGLTALRRVGMTVVEDVDLAAFRRAVAAVDDRLAKVFGADALGRLHSLAA